MSSLAPEHTRRHDARRKRRLPAESLASEAESGVNDQMFAHVRASHISRKAQKPHIPPKPTQNTFQFYGPVTIGDVVVSPDARDNRRRQTSSSAIPGSTHGLLQPTKS